MNPASSAGTEPDEPDWLPLWGDETEVDVSTTAGPVRIRRQRTPVALVGGRLQPMVPVDGVLPCGEIEVLEALRGGDRLVVDTRIGRWWRQGTIPGAFHLPWGEAVDRLAELGCSGSPEAGWDFTGARELIMFCNGPACGQAPAAIRAITEAGYPPEKIWFYRGGLQDWQVLGLTTVEGT